MVKIIDRIIKSPLENTDFDCGNPRINELVKESYFANLIQIAYTHEIKMDDEVVGYYMLQFKTISDDIPAEIGDYWDDQYGRTVPCVYLHFIAINKRFQNKGIGSAIMKLIIKNTMDMVEYVPIRIITLKSVEDKVDWYSKLGFKKLTNRENFESIMYLDCIKEENRVKLLDY